MRMAFSRIDSMTSREGVADSDTTLASSFEPPVTPIVRANTIGVVQKVRFYNNFMSSAFLSYRSLMPLGGKSPAAVHTPDRVTIGVDMSIPSSIGETQKARSRDTGLQFVIGQDETGHWVAVESTGRGGGIFVNRNAALKYATFEAGRRPNAVQCSHQRLSLWR